MRTDIYLHSSKDSNYEQGEKLGLKGKVLANFVYACYEVKVTVDVDEITGKATIVAVDDRELN